MRYEVTLDFGRGDCRTYTLDAQPAPDAVSASQAWLDDMFVQFDCEPIRLTGKVLTADKVLAIASEAGPGEFDRDHAWAQAYARATALALNRPHVRVNVLDRSVSY